MEARESFVFHREYIDDLPEEYKPVFAMYAINYGIYGMEPELTGLETALWTKIKRRIDYDIREWESVRDSRSNAGKSHKGNQYTKKNKVEQVGTNGTEFQKMEQAGTSRDKVEQVGTNGTVSVNESVNVSVPAHSACACEATDFGSLQREAYALLEEHNASAPDGKKIPDSMEKMRSLKAIEQVMNVDEKYQNSEMMKRAKSYHFETVSQFMAVFETSGYEAFIQDDDICIKRGGQVQEKIAVKEIEKLCRKNGDVEKKRIRQLRAILKKYRDQSTSREEMESLLKKKFGISMKFLGKEFSPYGYMVVDNATKTVFKGKDIIGIKELLQFQSREEKLQKVDFFIEDKLRENPLATTFDLNTDLYRFYGCYIKHDSIIMGKDKVELASYLVDKIRYNNKVAWVQGFSPVNDQQVRLLSKMFNISPEHLHVSENGNNTQFTINTVNELLEAGNDNDDNESIFDRLNDEGIWTYRFEDKLFCVTPSWREVVDLEAAGVDMGKFKASRSANIETSEHRHNMPQGKTRPISNEIGSSDRINYNPDANRNSYGEVDDERAMIRRS